jgi:uncharacterized protein (TIGR01777 family)
MKILIAGATGLVGKALVELCHNKGYSVNYLTTSKEKIVNKENYKGYYWNPKKGEIDTNCFNEIDVIVNLAGATIAKRWTTSYKKEILQSRIESSRVLFEGLKKTATRVRQYITASAIGVYPNSTTAIYDESYDSISKTFLGKVVSAWEKSADVFKELNITVTKVRIGLVLSSKGGALEAMIKPIKFGIGSPLGSGKQWQSWIHIDDLTRLIMHCIEQNKEGIYNAVSPNPVTNKDLTEKIAKTIDKPFWMPNVPKFILKIVLGEMHILLIESQKVSAKKVIESGFTFNYQDIEKALVDLLHKKKP